MIMMSTHSPSDFKHSLILEACCKVYFFRIWSQYRFLVLIEDLTDLIAEREWLHSLRHEKTILHMTDPCSLYLHVLKKANKYKNCALASNNN